MAKSKSKKRKSKKGRGRPKIEIDWDKFDVLCNIQCTLEEISVVLGYSEDTIERRVKEKHKVNFAEYYKRKSATARMSLRRLMWKKAIEEENITMMIFLSKQKHLLSYSDHVKTTPDDEHKRMMNFMDRMEKQKEKQK
jgi:hypothetical protein